MYNVSGNRDIFSKHKSHVKLQWDAFKVFTPCNSGAYCLDDHKPMQEISKMYKLNHSFGELFEFCT